MIFQQSGTHIDPHVSTIIMGVLQVLGILGSTTLVEFIGRKKLLIISLAGSTLGLSAMSTYMYLDSLDSFDLSMLHWVPVVSIGSVILISSVGIVPLVFVCIVEMLPSEVSRQFTFPKLFFSLKRHTYILYIHILQARGFGVTTGIVSLNIFAFISSKTFPILTELMQLHGCIAIYAIACAIGTIFITIVISESKGKNLDSMEFECEKNTGKSAA